MYATRFLRRLIFESRVNELPFHDFKRVSSYVNRMIEQTIIMFKWKFIHQLFEQSWVAINYKEMSRKENLIYAITFAIHHELSPKNIAARHIFSWKKIYNNIWVDRTLLLSVQYLRFMPKGLNSLTVLPEFECNPSRIDSFLSLWKWQVLIENTVKKFVVKQLWYET